MDKWKCLIITFSMIFTKDSHISPYTMQQRASTCNNNKSQAKNIPIRDFVKQNIKMSKNEKHFILPDKLDKLIKLKIKSDKFFFPGKKRLKHIDNRRTDEGQNNCQFDSGRNLIKQLKKNQKFQNKQQNNKQKVFLKEITFDSNLIDIDNGYKSNRNFQNLKTTQFSSRNTKISKKHSHKQQDDLGEVKFSNKLLSTFIKLNGEGKTEKFFAIGQPDDQKGIQINGYKAPFGETVDHFRLKTACQSPNLRNKKQKIYKTITDWC